MLQWKIETVKAPNEALKLKHIYVHKLPYCLSGHEVKLHSLFALVSRLQLWIFFGFIHKHIKYWMSWGAFHTIEVCYQDS